MNAMPRSMDKYSDRIDALVCLLYGAACIGGTLWLAWELSLLWW